MNKYTEEQNPNTYVVPINKGLVVPTPASFNLYFWSDQHFGACECNYELASNIINEIYSDSVAFVVMGGDTLEAIPRGYKISERGQTSTPDEQILISSDKLETIKDKIVVLFKGNHNTQARGESVDSDMILAGILGVPYKTVPTVIQFKSEKGIVKAAGGHGKSAAKNGDTELETLRKIFPGCHIYFEGHNHMLYAKLAGSLVYDEEGNEHWEGAYLVRTGNCLNYAEYARYGIYTPQQSGCVKFEIRDGKIFEAVIITEDYFKRKNAHEEKAPQEEE